MPILGTKGQYFTYGIYQALIEVRGFAHPNIFSSLGPMPLPFPPPKPQYKAQTIPRHYPIKPSSKSTTFS